MAFQLPADSGLLIECLIDAAGDRGILMVTDAPAEELNVAQRKVDAIVQELQRRLAW